MIKIMRNIKYTFQNLSGNAVREIIAIAVILCLSIALSIPAFIQDINKYRISMSNVINDGWNTSTPEEQGMDSGKLSQVGTALEQTDACSFIVVRHGFIVYENYYNQSNKNDCNNIFSVTKSFISALIGIAIREGYIKSPEDKLELYLPGYFVDIKDPHWKDITKKHLLTMTPGFCEDLQKWTGSSDWVKATLGLPLNYLPGEKFQYANSASHLLSFVLTKATGMSTYEFADKYLFYPLGIRKKQWSTDPQGNYTGYANLFLRPRDMAKFGYMYLRNGEWDIKQVVPKEWVEESTRVQFDFNTENQSGYENGYGFKWWINGETGYHMFSALGYGGQSINVIPELDLVVVITSIPDRAMSIDDKQRIEIIEQKVITSIIDKN